MKSATLKELKEELSSKTPKELAELILTLAKFKKENKELLTYLLYESVDEDVFISGVKTEIDEMFAEIKNTNIYFRKKSIRKILRITKKYIRYSKKKETEVALRIYFCRCLKKMTPAVISNASIGKLFDREIASINATINSMHEDLQFDYKNEINELMEEK